jgi:surface antigen
VKRLMLGGCGCTGALALLVLTIPLLFFGVGGTRKASAADASGNTAIMAAGSSCNAAVRCQSVPQELAYVPSGFYPDRYTKPAGECTSWAAALWPGHQGRGVTWSGDAWEWYANAAAQGYTAARAPAVGAIVVFARSSGDGGGWGHVGVVIAVASTSFRVTEMNFRGRYVVDERDVSRGSAAITGFIPVPPDAFS